jgi:flagellin
MTRINTNVGSLIAQKTLARSNTQLQESLTRLSTGLRINVGKDDPAGLIASEVLRSDIISVQRAITNSERANQIIATADSALGQVSSLLNDIRGLVSEAANTGALSDEQIAANQLQVDSSLEAIDRIAQTTSFQGRRLLDGSLDFITSSAAGSGFATGVIGTTTGVAATGIFGDPDGSPAAGSISKAAVGATGNIAIGTDNIALTAINGNAFNGLDVDIQHDGAAAAAATGNIAIGSDTISITAVGFGSEGTDRNGLNVTFTVAAVGQGNEVVNYVAGSNAVGITIDAASTTTDIRDALIAHAGFAAEFTAGGAGGAQTTPASPQNNVTSGGTDDVVTVDYNSVTKSAVVHATANSTSTQIRAALAAHSTFNAEYTSSIVGTGTQTSTAAVQNNITTGGFDLTSLDFTATENGAGGNGLDVTFAVDAGAAAGVTIGYNSGTRALTVTGQLATDLTATAIQTALQNNTAFAQDYSVAITGQGTRQFVALDSDTDVTAGGGGANQIRLTADATGTTLNDLDVTIVADAASAGAETAAIAAGVLTLHVHANSTAADAIFALNRDLGSQLTATLVGDGSGTFTAGTTANVVTGGVASNQFRLTARNAGTDYDNITVNFSVNAALGVGNETAAFDADNKILTITVDDASDVDDVIAAIDDDLGDLFSASAIDGGSGVFTDADDDTNATTGGSGSGSYQNLRIDQANFGTLSQIDVDVQIDTQATKARLVYSGGNLTSALSLQVGGKSGFEVFQFGATTDVEGIADALNLVSDATGITATVDGTDLILESTEYGSDAFVTVQALNVGGAFLTTLDDGLTQSSRTSGTDVALRINGVQATGQGLKASLNTSTLDLNFSVDESLLDGSNFTFSITGGGAIFQLGPDVVSNQQARLGIQGVSTSTLGGVSGSLYELRSGNDRDLATDVKGAAKIVDEVITSVTGLRGRLGAFQRTTLETNIFTLNDTIASLVEAESSIRDADFAVESARLTRAQILVQSGTSVLAIANQNPQNVLALLR